MPKEVYISGNIIGAVRVSGTVAISGLVGVQSGHISIQSGKISVLSGQLIAKTSGEVVSTRPHGQSDAPFTGYACTNTLVYSGVPFITHGKATILLECLEQGSGVEYTIRGYPLSGAVAHSITSGALVSGEIKVETLSDPYDWIEVGAENLVDNRTGVVTVFIARR